MRRAILTFSFLLSLFTIVVFGEAGYGLYPVDFKDGKYGEIQNGLQYYILGSNSGIAHLRVYILAGKNCEEESKTGLSRLTLETIVRTKLQNYSFKKISDLKEEKPFSFSFDTDENYAFMELTVLKEDLDFFVKVLREILFYAVITDENVIEAKNYHVGLKQIEKGSIVGRTRKELFKILYGESSAESKEINSDSYSQISVKDVDRFYKKYYKPSGCFIGISSSLSSEKAEQIIKNNFETVKSSQLQSCPASNIDDNESIVVILQKTGLEKSVLGVGKKINIANVNELDKDLPVLELAFSVVYSDSPHSRLIKQFMVDRNLAEILDFSFLISKKQKRGFFMVFLYPESKDVGFSSYIVGRVFSDLITKPPEGDELKKAKMAVLSNLHYVVSDPRKLLKTNMEFILRGFPPNYLKTYSRILCECSTEDLVRVCKEYFSMTKYQYVIYGSGEKFSREMGVFGKVTIKNAAIEN